MKKSTKNVLRVIISLLYIVWGIWSPISAFSAILAFDLSALVGAAVGVVMLLAGIFGLFGVKSPKCKLFGVIIFIGAVASIILALPTSGISWSNVVSAVLAWFYIACV